MLKFSTPLQKAVLIKRYKRFFADVRLEDSGQTVVAHCPNTGTMKTCGAPGDAVLVTYNPDPKRKLHYTWEFTFNADGGLIGVNTARPNLVVEHGIQQGLIQELRGYKTLRREVKYGENSRIDLLLTEGQDERPCYVEVKNTTLLHDGLVMFPDAVTERGLKHLDELSKVVACGSRAVMFYLVNRPDGRAFQPARHIDAAYCVGLEKARESGVEILAYRAENCPAGCRIGAAVDIEF